MIVEQDTYRSWIVTKEIGESHAGREYLVWWDEGGWKCSCRGALHHGTTCKHQKEVFKRFVEKFVKEVIAKLKLTDIRNIGEKTEEGLRSHGIRSVGELSAQHPRDISEMIDVPESRASQWVSQAQDMMLETEVRMLTARELRVERLQKMRYIPLGAKNFDGMFLSATPEEKKEGVSGSGGIRTGALTSVFGESATGKTQLAHQLAVNCLAVLEEPAIYIETEPNTWSWKRFNEMSEGKDVDPDDMYVIPADSCTDVYAMYNAYELVRRKAQENGLGALIMDSFSARFRQDFGPRETLAERSQEVGRHVKIYQNIAAQFNTAIFITLQAQAVPDEKKKRGLLKKYGIGLKPTVGRLIEHSASYGLALEYISKVEDVWRAHLWDSPEEDRLTAEYKVTREGIQDVD